VHAKCAGRRAPGLTSVVLSASAAAHSQQLTNHVRGAELCGANSRAVNIVC